MPNLLEKTWTSMHRGIYRLSGGRVMGSFDGMPVLMLTTTGRRSGKARTTPLMYVEENETYAVVGSAAGRPQHPAWFLNLQTSPGATVRIGKETRRVRARVADGAERERLFGAFKTTAKRYAGYEQKTARRIPVVILEPASN